MKDYSFKLYDKRFVEAVDRWTDNGYTIRGMVEELLAKYEGLEVPKPSDIQELHIELRRQREEIERLKKDQQDFLQILMLNIADIEKIKADTGTLFRLTQPPHLPTSSPAATE